MAFSSEKKDKKYLISVEGSVGSGKSTLLREIESQEFPNTRVLWEPDFSKVDLNGQQYNLLKKLYVNDIKKDDYLAIQLAICDNLRNYYNRNVTNKKFLISDRCLSSCKIFNQMGFNNGQLSNFTKDYVMSHINSQEKSFLDSFSGGIEVYKLYLDTKPEICGQRVIKRGRTEELSKSTEFWSSFAETFKEVAFSLDKYDHVGDKDSIYRKIVELVKIINLREGS